MRERVTPAPSVSNTVPPLALRCALLLAVRPSAPALPSDSDTDDDEKTISLSLFLGKYWRSRATVGTVLKDGRAEKFSVALE